MMQTHGMAVATMKKYLVENFGEDGFNEWLSQLTLTPKELFSKRVSPAKWYPTTQLYLKPMSEITTLFFDGDEEKAGRHYGKFSSEFALKRLFGLAGMILGGGGPINFINRANRVLSLYHKPINMEAEVVGDNEAIARITEFAELTRLYEYVILGYTDAGLTVTGCKDVSTQLKSSLIDGDTSTEFLIQWQ